MAAGWTFFRHPIIRGFAVKRDSESCDDVTESNYSRIQALISAQSEGNSVLETCSVYIARPHPLGLPQRLRDRLRAAESAEYARVPTVCD
jgi:hypothetical protein